MFEIASRFFVSSHSTLVIVSSHAYTSRIYSISRCHDLNSIAIPFRKKLNQLRYIRVSLVFHNSHSTFRMGGKPREKRIFFVMRRVTYFCTLIHKHTHTPKKIPIECLFSFVLGEPMIGQHIMFRVKLPRKRNISNSIGEDERRKKTAMKKKKTKPSERSNSQPTAI